MKNFAYDDDHHRLGFINALSHTIEFDRKYKYTRRKKSIDLFKIMTAISSLGYKKKTNKFLSIR